MELIKPPTEFWLSVVSFRRPKQKLHTSLGHARNAIAGRTYWSGGVRIFEEIDGIRTGQSAYTSRVQGGQIWQWNGSDWELLHDIADGTLAIRLPWRTADLGKYEFYVKD